MMKRLITFSVCMLILLSICSCSSKEETPEPTPSAAPVSGSDISTAEPEGVETVSPSPTAEVTAAPSPSESPEVTENTAPIVSNNKTYSANINKPEYQYSQYQDYLYEIDIRLIDYVGVDAFFDWFDDTDYSRSAMTFRKYFGIDDELYKVICDDETINYRYIDALYKVINSRYSGRWFSTRPEPTVKPTAEVASPTDIENTPLLEGYFTSEEVQYNSIFIGETTAKQLIEKLGEPNSSENIDDITYIYHYDGVKYYSSATSGLITEIVITVETEDASPRDIQIGDTITEVLTKFPVENELINGYGIVYGDLTDARCRITGDTMTPYEKQNNSIYKMMYFNTETINPFMMLRFKDDVLYEITLATGYFFSQEAKYYGITVNHTTSAQLYDILGEPKTVTIRLDQLFFIYYYYDGVRYETRPEGDNVYGIVILKNINEKTPYDIKIGDSYESVIMKFPYEFIPESNNNIFFGVNTTSGAGGFIYNSSTSLNSIIVTSIQVDPYLVITFKAKKVYSIALCVRYD